MVFVVLGQSLLKVRTLNRQIRSLGLNLLCHFKTLTNLLNLGTLKSEDFVGSVEQGIRLERAALKRYLAAYEEAIETPVAHEDGARSMREELRRQVAGVARWLREGVPYVPYRFPC